VLCRSIIEFDECMMTYAYMLDELPIIIAKKWSDCAAGTSSQRWKNGLKRVVVVRDLSVVARRVFKSVQR
jgi:hypothetical protein